MAFRPIYQRIEKVSIIINESVGQFESRDFTKNYIKKRDQEVNKNKKYCQHDSDQDSIFCSC